MRNRSKVNTSEILTSENVMSANMEIVQNMMDQQVICSSVENNQPFKTAQQSDVGFGTIQEQAATGQNFHQTIETAGAHQQRRNLATADNTHGGKRDKKRNNHINQRVNMLDLTNSHQTQIIKGLDSYHGSSTLPKMIHEGTESIVSRQKTDFLSKQQNMELLSQQQK